MECWGGMLPGGEKARFAVRNVTKETKKPFVLGGISRQPLELRYGALVMEPRSGKPRDRTSDMRIDETVPR